MGGLDEGKGLDSSGDDSITRTNKSHIFLKNGQDSKR
jgi:hypothetical protein